MSAWAVGSVAIASVLALPSLVVLLSLGDPAYDVWAHLWRTQLLELISNTLALLAGVGAGTLLSARASPGSSSRIASRDAACSSGRSSCRWRFPPT